MTAEQPHMLKLVVKPSRTLPVPGLEYIKKNSDVQRVILLNTADFDSNIEITHIYNYQE